MRAPLLEALRPVPGSAMSSSTEGESRFLVVRSGWFGGHRWVAGQVLVCRGEPRMGDSVVLVSRRGREVRPRLGRVEGTRFLGEAGERCHPGRWRAAGAVVATYRFEGSVPSGVDSGGRGASPVIELRAVATGQSAGEGSSVATAPSRRSRQAADCGAQLSLFAA